MSVKGQLLGSRNNRLVKMRFQDPKLGLVPLEQKGIIKRLGIRSRFVEIGTIEEVTASDVKIKTERGTIVLKKTPGETYTVGGGVAVRGKFGMVMAHAI